MSHKNFKIDNADDLPSRYAALERKYQAQNNRQAKREKEEKARKQFQRLVGAIVLIVTLVILVNIFF